MSSIHIGSVLRVTRAVHNKGGANLLRDPAYAIVIGFNKTGHPCVRWVGPQEDGITLFLKRMRGVDEFIVCSPDDIPDNVLVELARMQLVGELNVVDS